ncbi:hypothetical protein LXL04_034836 [Taraxacum kok-saghyz]
MPRDSLCSLHSLEVTSNPQSALVSLHLQPKTPKEIRQHSRNLLSNSRLSKGRNSARKLPNNIKNHREAKLLEHSVDEFLPYDKEPEEDPEEDNYSAFATILAKPQFPNHFSKPDFGTIRFAFVCNNLAFTLSEAAETSDKNYVASVRVRVLEEDRDIDRVIITTTRTDLVDTRARSTDVERRIAGLPGQTDATNTLALLAEGRSDKTHISQSNKSLLRDIFITKRINTTLRSLPYPECSMSLYLAIRLLLNYNKFFSSYD